MALMLADKQAGPFSLRVAWIAAEKKTSNAVSFNAAALLA